MAIVNNTMIGLRVGSVVTLLLPRTPMTRHGKRAQGH